MRILLPLTWGLLLPVSCTHTFNTGRLCIVYLYEANNNTPRFSFILRFPDAREPNVEVLTHSDDVGSTISLNGYSSKEQVLRREKVIRRAAYNLGLT